MRNSLSRWSHSLRSRIELELTFAFDVIQTGALGKRSVRRASPTRGMGQHHELPRWLKSVHWIQFLRARVSRPLLFLCLSRRTCLRDLSDRMKYIIFTLILNFKVTPALPAHMIERKSGIVLRPCVKGEDDGRPQLPLLIQPVVRTSI